MRDPTLEILVMKYLNLILIYFPVLFIFQESPYQSLQMINCICQTSRSSDNKPSSSQGRSLGESSFSGSGDYDLALDEAVARSLQELDFEDEQVDHVVISESLPTASSK